MKKKYELHDSQNREFKAFQYGDPGKNPLVLVMPGGHCDGERYHWIGKGLEEKGYASLILDAPEEYRTTPFSPDKPVKTKIIAIEHPALVLRYLGLEDKSYIAIGHSHGAAIILDDLGKGDQSVLKSHSGCVILGTHLQAEAFGKKIPGRSDTSPLTKPENLPVLFIAGECDDIAPPKQVARTCNRYTGNTYFLSQQGANHLNWAEGAGWADRPDLDGKASVDPDSQRNTTLSYFEAFIGAVSANANIADALAKAVQEKDKVYINQNIKKII